jgi:cystathionine beta-lyase
VRHCLHMNLKPPQRYEEPVPDAGFETLCIHYAEDPAAQKGAAAVPIYQTSTFIYPGAEAYEARRTPQSPYYDYTRVGNPTTASLEAKLARLERAEWAYALGSGMGAVSAAINACVQAGSHVVALSHVYGPTRTYLNHLRRFGVQTTFVDSCEAERILAALRPETRLIYLESPTSGYLEIVDIPAVTSAARARGIATVFDNSCATPFFQRPLELGVDLVVHSATKYLNGHSDVVAGLVAGRDPHLHKRICTEVEYGGATLDPLAAWLVLRGLRSLALRMERHQANGLAVARMLAEHPAVARVNYPGLETHPGHALARRQMSGFSGLVSFVLRDASRAATYRFLNRLRLFRIGVSWGGYESLAVAWSQLESREETSEWLIRLSVGLESVTDLIADLRQALEG